MTTEESTARGGYVSPREVLGVEEEDLEAGPRRGVYEFDYNVIQDSSRVKINSSTVIDQDSSQRVSFLASEANQLEQEPE